MLAHNPSLAAGLADTAAAQFALVCSGCPCPDPEPDAPKRCATCGGCLGRVDVDRPLAWCGGCGAVLAPVGRCCAVCSDQAQAASPRRRASRGAPGGASRAEFRIPEILGSDPVPEPRQ